MAITVAPASHHRSRARRQTPHPGVRSTETIADSLGLPPAQLGWGASAIKLTIPPSPIAEWVAVEISAGAFVATHEQAEQGLKLRRALSTVRERINLIPYRDDQRDQALADAQAKVLADVGIVATSSR